MKGKSFSMSIEYPKDVIDRMELDTHIVTYNEMRDAIAYTMVSNTGRACKEAEDIAAQGAQQLLNFYGFSDNVLDNVLTPHERSVFWDMEDEGIIKRGKGMEILLIGGKTWKIRYWELNKKNIVKYSKAYNEAKESPPAEDLEQLYQNVTDEAWQHGAAEAHT